jgi:hypothetical protein
MFHRHPRTEDVARINREETIVYSSGDRAQKSRGIKISDDTTLPSQTIVNNENIGRVLSSGSRAQKQRSKDKHIDNGKGKGKAK